MQRSVLFIFFIIPIAGLPQTDITGSIQDQEGIPIPYVHVLLLKSADSLLVKGAVTDESGEFVFDQVDLGDYILNASMMGYSDFYSDKLTLSVQQAEYAYGIIQLNESAQQLEGVELISKKPLFERQVDRTIVNVQNSVTSVGGTALEVLEKSPGINVNRQSGSLSMNGKAGVLVMINDKISRMPTEAIVQMLNGMSAANIDRIELISNPPAKYDSEGNAGIIHIVLIENMEAGTSGNVGATLGQNTGATWGLNFNLNHSENGVNSFLGYSVFNDRNSGIWATESSFEDEGFKVENVSQIDRTNTAPVHNLRLGTSFHLGQKTTARLLATGYLRRWEQDSESSGTNRVSGDSSITFVGDIWEENLWMSATGSIGVDHEVKEGKVISATLDYLYYYNDQPSRFDTDFFVNDAPNSVNELVTSEKETPISSWIGRVDYSHVLNEVFSWDTGAKASFSSFENEVLVERTVGDSTVIDPDFTNQASLRENIWAAYASARFTFKNNWILHTGLRYERTLTQLDTPDEGRIVDRDFGNLFPNLTLSHDLDEGKNVSAAYNRRITRPTYNDLAPFVFFANPTTFLAGNTSLLPAISDNIEFTYRTPKWWLTLRYGNEKDAIAAWQPSVDTETGLQVFSPQNLDYSRTAGLQLNVPLKLTSWWEWQNDFSLNYLNLKPKQTQSSLTVQNTNFLYNGIITFLLPKDYTIELNGMYQGKTFWGVLEFEPLGRFDIGLKKTFNNGGSLSIVGTDIFNTFIWKADIYEGFDEDLQTSVEYTFGIQGFVVSYTMPFGNKNIKALNIESGSEEERKRVTN